MNIYPNGYSFSSWEIIVIRQVLGTLAWLRLQTAEEVKGCRGKESELMSMCE